MCGPFWICDYLTILRTVETRLPPISLTDHVKNDHQPIRHLIRGRSKDSSGMKGKICVHLSPDPPWTAEEKESSRSKRDEKHLFAE